MQTDGQMGRQTDTTKLIVAFSNIRTQLETEYIYMSERFNEEILSSEVINHRSTQRDFFPFVEHEVSLVRLQQPTLGSYHGPVQSSPEPETKFLFSAILTK
jgi:hypothetical protein